MNDAGTESIEDEFFVVDSVRVGTIATAQNHWSQSARSTPVDDRCNDRRLARAADGQIAHADNGDRRIPRSNGADVEGPIAQTPARTVEEGRESEPATGDCGERPARATANQI